MVPVILDIIANSDDNHVQEFQIKADIENLKEEYNYWEKRVNKLRDDYMKECNEQIKWRNDIEEYVNKMLAQLETCETEEGRDRIKLAQMYVNSVNVVTKYDNTAFTIGLSAILSNGKVAPVDELRKINKKIPMSNSNVL